MNLSGGELNFNIMVWQRAAQQRHIDVKRAIGHKQAKSEADLLMKILNAVIFQGR